MNLDEILRSVVKNSFNFKIYSDGRINYKNTRMKSDEFFVSVINPLLVENNLWNLAASTSFRSDTMLLLKNICLETSTTNRHVVDGENKDMSHLVPIIDAQKGEKVLINLQTGLPSRVSYEVYVQVHGAKKSVPDPALLEFDPYDISPLKLVPFEGMNLPRYNLYIQPEWQKRRGLLTLRDISDLSCPEILEEFFIHLFPKDEVREFVFDWMHFALTNKCETYLVLNGPKGVGKGLFCEHIMMKLIGEQYFGIAPESGLTSDFNSFLFGKRLVMLDEIKVNTAEKISKLKRYINPNQNIERKGIDANQVVKTYNSFIISNNDISDMHIEWDDRRFSVADLNTVKLKDVWPKEKIDRVANLTEEEIEEFGNWIFNREPQVMEDRFSMLRGKHFWEICYSSLAEWQKVIVDLVINGDQTEYPLSDLRRELKKRSGQTWTIRNQRVSEFLKNYSHQGEFTIGSLEGDGAEAFIVPSKHYLKAPIEGADLL